MDNFVVQVLYGFELRCRDWLMTVKHCKNVRVVATAHVCFQVPDTVKDESGKCTSKQDSVAVIRKFLSDLLDEFTGSIAVYLLGCQFAACVTDDVETVNAIKNSKFAADYRPPAECGALLDVRSVATERRVEWTRALERAADLACLYDARPLLVRLSAKYSHKTECARVRDSLHRAQSSSMQLVSQFADQLLQLVAQEAAAAAAAAPLCVLELNTKNTQLSLELLLSPRCSALLIPLNLARNRIRPSMSREAAKGLDVAQSFHQTSLARGHCPIPMDWDRLVATHPLLTSTSASSAATAGASSVDVDDAGVDAAAVEKSFLQQAFEMSTSTLAPAGPPKKKRAVALTHASKSDAALTGEMVPAEQTSVNNGDDYDNEETADADSWASERGPTRLRRAETVLQGRIGWLLVVLDRCYDSHNAQAVLRTCEALGVQHVWLVEPDLSSSGSRQQPQDESFFSARVTRNIDRWLTIRFFQTSQQCLDALRAAGRSIWLADVLPSSEPLTAISSEQVRQAGNIALVVGRESDGVSDTFREPSGHDRSVYLPTSGFCESLNLSVACALMVHHLLQLRAPPASATATADDGADDEGLAAGTDGAADGASSLGDLSDQEKSQLRERWFRQLAVGKTETQIQRYLTHPPEPLPDLRRHDFRRLKPPSVRRKETVADEILNLMVTKK